MNCDWNKMVEITVPVGINGWVYAGSVTINGVTVDFPIGIHTSVPEPVAELLKKFIALEEDKNKVPEQGAGGTWVLECVGFKITNTTEAGLIIGSGQASHTFEEMVQSINNGRIPVLKFSMEGQGMLFLPLLNVTDEAIVFSMGVHGTQSTGLVEPDGLIQITLNEPV